MSNPPPPYDLSEYSAPSNAAPLSAHGYASNGGGYSTNPTFPPYRGSQQQAGYSAGTGPGSEKGKLGKVAPGTGTTANADHLYASAPPPTVSTASFPVTEQPIGSGDAKVNSGRKGCDEEPPVPVPLNFPPGLEYLKQINSLHVKERAHFGRELGSDVYKINNSLGQGIFTAREEYSDCCTYSCYCASRPFDIKVKDGLNRDVIHVRRPYTSWGQTAEVYCPPGLLVGTVVQEWRMCERKLVVKNSTGDIVFRIEGSSFSCSSPDEEFHVLSNDGSAQVGKISNRWSGCLGELTGSHKFEIQFPINLDVKMKAVLLGACFLIDFAFFKA